MPGKWNVQAPDGKVIQFPDEFTSDDVNREMGKIYAPSTSPESVGAPGVSAPFPPLRKGSSSQLEGGQSPIISSAPEESGLMTGPLSKEKSTLTGRLTGTDPLMQQFYARTAASAADIPSAISGALESVTAPPTSEEKTEFPSLNLNSPVNRVPLAAQRMVGQPIQHAVDWYEQAARGKVPKPIEQAQSVAPEALGQGIQAVGTGALTDAVMKKVVPSGVSGDVPSATDKLKMRQALRPQDKDLRFDQSVGDAWSRMKDQISQNGMPATLGDFYDLLKNAKKQVWSEITSKLQTAQNTKPPIKGLLPSPTAEIDTGVQSVQGEAPGGVLRAESQPANRYGHPPFPSDQGTFPLRSEQPPQFLSGGAHPEMSGQLTNPATLLTRDTSAISATRDRLASVVNDESKFSKLTPGEQSAYESQLSRLNKLLEPGPSGVVHGPSIDGNQIANAIEKSIRPRGKLFADSSVQELKARADAYRGRTLPLDYAEELLQDANREASSWYQGASRDPHGPQYQVSAAAEADSLRNQLYTKIDELTKSDPGTARQLKKEYGALNSLQKATGKRIPVVSRQAPMNLSQQIMSGALPVAALELAMHGGLSSPEAIGTAALGYGGTKLAKYINAPETLLKSALREPTNVPAPISQALRKGAAVGAGSTALKGKRQ